MRLRGLLLLVLVGCGTPSDEPPAADSPPPARVEATPLAVDEGAPKLLPVDQADESFRAFRDSLLAALARRDTTALYGVLSPDVRTSFGAEGGIDDFRGAWSTDDPGTRVWEELARVLGMGGVFSADSTFMAPYVYAAWPDSIDAFEFVAVTSPEAAVRSAPGSRADTIGTASYSILRLADWRGMPETAAEPDTSWAGVVLPDGRTGWLSAHDVHSPIGWRAIFGRRDGRWWIDAFVAGD